MLTRTSRLLLVPLCAVGIMLLALAAVSPAPLQLGHQDPEEVDLDDCLRCHEPLRKTLALPTPHAPAAEGLCIACHSPHAARYPKMLQHRERALCNICHEESILEFQLGSVHTPVREGRCSGCHDPHAAEHAGLLKQEGNQLCFSCHDAVLAQTKWPNVHSPVVDGECSFCHLPHNSPNPNQLTEAGSAICTQCHEDDDEDLLEVHHSIPIEGKDCRRCHQPHASKTKDMLRDVVHKPFADGECHKCHVINKEEAIMSLVATGARLCGQCHENYPRAGDPTVHAPVKEGNCGACHRSHAGDIPKLLATGNRALCVGCHQEIETRYENAKAAHPRTVESGSCTICHQAHSSKEAGLLNSDGIRTCLPCHQNQRHGHPMGADRTDPRTGKGMTCLSCHDPHGTEFPYFLVGDQTRGLCVECHTGEEDHKPKRKRR